MCDHGIARVLTSVVKTTIGVFTFDLTAVHGTWMLRQPLMA